MRNHNPVLLEEFNGLFVRGAKDSCPYDHFSNCNNIQFDQSAFKTRYGIGPHDPFRNVARVYTWNQSLLILDTNGNIYVNDRAPDPFVPILHVNGMTDFTFHPFANHAYISPNNSSSDNEVIYVVTYGSSNNARKAAGKAPTIAPTLITGGSGNVEQGIHVVAVAYETDTGFITSISPAAQIIVDGATTITVGLPISSDSFVKARHVLATKAIDPADFTGNLNGYEFFFQTRVDNNTDSSVDINFYDAELLNSADYLQDLYDEIPNTVGLELYHGRLLYYGIKRGNTGDQLSNVLVSNAGDPESVNKVSGLVQVPFDGKPLTDCVAYRDVLYLGKATKFLSCIDNQDVPSSWPVEFIDHGIGPVGEHGIATILDMAGANVDYILVSNFSGLYLFDGSFRSPELSYKIFDYWLSNVKGGSQIAVDSFNRIIYIIDSNNNILMGDFKNGIDAKSIRWTPWSFDVKATAICILEQSVNDIRLIIGTKNS